MLVELLVLAGFVGYEWAAFVEQSCFLLGIGFDLLVVVEVAVEGQVMLVWFGRLVG